MFPNIPKLLSSRDNFNNFYSKFDLKEKVGKGSFFDTWLCVQQNNERDYAAKVLKKDYENRNLYVSNVNSSTNKN